MAGQLTHREIEELLGAYALDAVPADEAGAVELHLRDCPRCRSEVADHREAAAALAHVGAPAPEGLWSRIASSLEEAPPSLDMARVVAMRPPRPEPARRGRGVPLQVAAAVAAVAAAVIGVLGVRVVDQGRRIDGLAQGMEQEGVREAVQAALLDPTARKVQLRSDDGAVFADTVVRPSGEAWLVRHNLPALPEGRTYQLWAVTGDRAVSVGLLGAEPGQSSFRVDGDGVQALAVTAEVAGGVAAPSSGPIAKATVRA